MSRSSLPRLPKARSVIPRCMQPQPLLECSIEEGQRLQQWEPLNPALSGYQLHLHRKYRVSFTPPDGQSDNWELSIPVTPWFIVVDHPCERNHQTVSLGFKVRRATFSELVQPTACFLEVQLKEKTTSQLNRSSVPIGLVKTGRAVLVTLILGLLGVVGVIWNQIDSQMQGSLLTKTLVGGSGILLLLLVIWQVAWRWLPGKHATGAAKNLSKRMEQQIQKDPLPEPPEDG